MLKFPPLPFVIVYRFMNVLLRGIWHGENTRKLIVRNASQTGGIKRKSSVWLSSIQQYK